jgi:glycosyltransferase involved in cell wall biosynthesis
MRVLHIASGNFYGGVETLLVTLARHRALCPAMEPAFGLCFDGRLSEALAAADVPVHLLGRVRVRRPASVWRARRALVRLVQRARFEVVVCHAPWAYVIFGPVVRAAGVPLILWLHGPVSGLHWLERWARRTPPDLVIANSRFTAGTLQALYPGAPNDVVYPPIAAPDLWPSEGDRAAVRAELGTPQDALVIVQVSRMEPWKGHELHLEALGLLRDLPGWVCWQVGGAQRPAEARYVERLKQVAARLGIAQRIRFVGQRSDVPKLLAAADVHCQPNTGPEPFGITFIEALYAGLPVATTAMGGAREILDDSCGILVPPGDAPALAAALRRLMQCPALRGQLGAAGPARARVLCEPRAQLPRLYASLQNASNAHAAKARH